jgi:anthranilate phosphoribosyltransferase
MPLTASQATELIHRPSGLTEAEALEVLDLLMSGTLAPAEGAALLVEMSERGETGAEVAAFVRGLLARAAPIPLSRSSLDVCGTGGSGLTRFNVSTTVAFVLAAVGVPVAKHGNRGSLKPNGSFDLLDQLEVAYALPPERLATLHRDTGVCFLFARAVHPAVAAVAPYRKAAGRRTIFNLAGPLANPARPARQVVGVTNERTGRVIADAMVRLGVERAAVVWGGPGIDEFSITGESRCLLVAGGAPRLVTMPALHPHLEHEELPGGDAPENAAIFHRLIGGEERGPLRDMVALNAGAAIDLWEDRVPSAKGEGIARATEALRSGAVKEAFVRHRDAARRLAG